MLLDGLLHRDAEVPDRVGDTTGTTTTRSGTVPSPSPGTSVMPIAGGDELDRGGEVGGLDGELRRESGLRAGGQHHLPAAAGSPRTVCSRVP